MQWQIRRFSKFCMSLGKNTDAIELLIINSAVHSMCRSLSELYVINCWKYCCVRLNAQQREHREQESMKGLKHIECLRHKGWMLQVRSRPWTQQIDTGRPQLAVFLFVLNGRGMPPSLCHARSFRPTSIWVLSSVTHAWSSLPAMTTSLNMQGMYDPRYQIIPTAAELGGGNVKLQWLYNSYLVDIRCRARV